MRKPKPRGEVDPLAYLHASGGMDSGGNTPQRRRPNNPQVNENYEAGPASHYTRAELETARRYGQTPPEREVRVNKGG